MKNTKRNWKTSLIGLLMLLGASAAVANDPENIKDPTTLTTVATGVGLILAKDGDRSGTAKTAADAD